MKLERRKLFLSTKVIMKSKLIYKRNLTYPRINSIEAFSLACVRPTPSSKGLASTSLKLIELQNYNRKIKVITEIR